jgi:hypothetical protein
VLVDRRVVFWHQTLHGCHMVEDCSSIWRVLGLCFRRHPHTTWATPSARCPPVGLPRPLLHGVPKIFAVIPKYLALDKRRRTSDRARELWCCRAFVELIRSGAALIHPKRPDFRRFAFPLKPLRSVKSVHNTTLQIKWRASSCPKCLCANFKVPTGFPSSCASACYS